MVLLDENRTTSRVAFSWQATEADGGAQQAESKTGNKGSPKRIDSSCLTLAESAGIMGAVLIRIPENTEPLDLAMFHNATQQLAARLEECVLRQCLDRSDREAQALSRISNQAANSVITEVAYQCVVDEIKSLVDFHRFTIFLIDRKTGALECAFQADAGGQSFPLDGPRCLAGTGCERLMSVPQSQIVEDLQALPGDIWPELSAEAGFRSAIIAPLVFEGDVVGAAVVRNFYPKAFGLADESLICRAVDLLNPAIISPAIDASSASDTQSGSREISNIIAVGHRIEGMLDLFADAAGKLVQFDFVTVTWLDLNGYDIHTCQSKLRPDVGGFTNIGPVSSPSGKKPQDYPLVSIQAHLRFGGENFGTLTLSRSAASSFGPQDLKTLDLLATHMSVAVENDRVVQRRTLQHPETRAGLAHALRTPLSSIKGYSSSLLQTDISWTPEVRKEFQETIDREADHLNRVIDDLLVAVDSSSSELPLARSVTTVDTLLRLAEAKLLTSDGWPRVVRFQPLPSQSLVLMDQTRIAQVLVYLLECAASSTPEGSELLVRVSNSGDRIEVTIGARQKDVGPLGGNGPTQFITSSVPHFLLDPPMDQMDDALRLSVCRTVIEAHGTELEVGKAGEPERMFTFKLPVFNSGQRTSSPYSLRP